MAVLNTIRRINQTAAYLANHLSARNDSIWVFGNRKGFTDNPRYLAEHLLHASTTVSPWWIARTDREADAARAAGLKASVWNTREARQVQRKAGVAFLTNGFQDLQTPLVGGARLVNLYHGTPIKRINLDADFSRFSSSRLVRAFPRVYRWSLAAGAGQLDLLVAPGALAQRRFVSAFGRDADHVAVLGTPRFDVIQGGEAYRRVAHGDVREQIGVDRNVQLLLWLPTWREHGEASWLPSLSDADFVEHLAGTNSVIVLKAHPRTDIATLYDRLPRGGRFRVLTETTVDVHCLMREADALITDYSSAAYDYAILGRPVYFFVPDLAEYARAAGFYQPLEEVSGGGHHLTWAGLLAAIRADAEGKMTLGLSTAAHLAQLSGNRSELGSCERIVDAVQRLIGLPHLGGV